MLVLLEVLVLLDEVRLELVELVEVLLVLVDEVLEVEEEDV